MILLFFLLRMLTITQPPLEASHHWRQVTGLMVARNFHESGIDLLHPRVDEVGVGTRVSSGIIGMEFPALNALHAYIANWCGYEHWYGRLIVLIFSSLGVWFFIRIINLFYNPRVAFISGLLLTCSIWFSFSRKMMPDVVAISIAMSAVYFLLKSLEKKNFLFLFLYLFLSSLSLLVKVSSGIFLAVVPLIIWWNREKKMLAVIAFLLSFFPLAICYYWYGVHNVIVSSASEMWYNSGEGFIVGWTSIASNLWKVIHYFLFETMMGYGASIAGLFFLLAIFFQEKSPLRVVGCVMFFVFLLFCIYSGRHFSGQHYYMIPLSPLFAFAIAYGLEFWVRTKWNMAIVFVLCLESLLNQQHDFRLKKSEMYKLELESILDQFSQKTDLIVLNGEGNPQELYFSHRKGWTTTSVEIENSDYLKALSSSGAKWLVINKSRSSFRPIKQYIAFEDDHYLITTLAY